MKAHRNLSTGKAKWPKISSKKLSPVYLYGDQIFTIEGVLTLEESQRFVEWAEGMGFAHQGSRGPAFGEAFRDNGRTGIESCALAEQLWSSTGLNKVMSEILVDGEEPIGLNSNVRLYKYAAGQRFGRHIDEGNFVKEPKGTTCYTLLVYLSDCVGGETVFYNHRGKKLASVSPKPGLALLHRHGDDCLEHEGGAVKGGIKYVLRSDVVYGGGVS